MRHKRFATLQSILQKLERADYYWKIGFFGLAIGGSVHLLFIFLFAYLHVWILSAVNIVSVAMYWYAIFGLLMDSLHRGNSKETDAKIGWIVFVELLFHNVLASYFLGRGSGFVYYVYVLIGLPFFADAYDRKVYILQKAIAIGAVFAVMLCHCFDLNKTSIPEDFITAMHYMNLFLFLVIMSMLTYAYTDNARAYQKTLKEESERDALSGLYNRRFILRRLIDAASAPSAIAMIDIDCFKRINDTYGHQCGDRVIRHIAQTIESRKGGRGIGCRWGGEEFLLLFDSVDFQRFGKILEEIRHCIENDLIECNKERFSVTVTIGAVYDRLGRKNYEAMLAIADKALYEGKEGGRNRVVVKEI